MRGGLCSRRDPAGVIWLLLVLLMPSMSRPASNSGAMPPTSIMLVAPDQLPDPNFSGSIVLVMNDLGPGPIGIIVNRPMRISVSHLFPELKRLAKLPDKVYFGGPVDLETVWFLFRAGKPPERAVRACEGVYLSADRRLFAPAARPRQADGPSADLHRPLRLGAGSVGGRNRNGTTGL